MSDTDLAGALHKKFYSDMPAEEFNSKIGLKAAEPATPVADKPRDWADVPGEAIGNIPSSAYHTAEGLVGQAASIAKTTAPYALKYGTGAPAAMAVDAAKAVYNDPDMIEAIWLCGLEEVWLIATAAKTQSRRRLRPIRLGLRWTRRR